MTQNIPAELVSMDNCKHEVREESASSIDAICMAVNVFNTLSDTVPPADLWNLNTTNYAAAVKIMQKTDFEGASGRVSFPENGTQYGAGDRETVPALYQVQDRELRKVGTVKAEGGAVVVTIDDGEAIKFYGGSTWTSEIVGLPSNLYATCSSPNPNYNYVVNECEPCPDNKQFDFGSKTCECKGGFEISGSTCKPCAPGKFTKHLGSICRNCSEGNSTGFERISYSEFV